MNKEEKKIAIFDLDGTLITHHLWTGIIKYRLKTKENLFWSVWYLITHFLYLPLWKLSLISAEKFYRSWGKDLPMMLRGIETKRANEIFAWLCDEYLLLSLKEEVFNRLKKHQEDGFIIILLSGSFQELVDIIAKRLNIDLALGTELGRKGTKFSGKIVEPLCFFHGKKIKLQKLLEKENIKINFEESFSYSDSIFDLPVLGIVKNPVVVSPDKKLLAIAKKNNWTII